jgi:hypothetical protein
MDLSNPTTRQFFEWETSLHKKEVRNSPQAVAELLADEFVEFGSSGRIFDKAAIIAMLKNEVVDLQVTVENFAVRELAPGVGLVTYLSASQAGGGRSLRSSIWRLLDGRWQMIFHQGTRIPQADADL